jgi:biopolymer transport protein ExbD
MSFGSIGFEGKDEGDLEDLAQINIIPLVDIMLVLLITFMIAAPLSIRGINVNLPTSRAKGQTVEGSKVVLTIDAEGRYFLDKVKIPADKLTDRFSAIFAVKKEKNLFIRADKDVVFKKVVDAMSAAKIAGVEHIGMLTTPPPRNNG